MTGGGGTPLCTGDTQKESQHLQISWSTLFDRLEKSIQFTPFKLIYEAYKNQGFSKRKGVNSIPGPE